MMKKLLTLALCMVSVLTLKAQVNISLDGWVFSGATEVVFTSEEPNVDTKVEEIFSNGYTTGESAAFYEDGLVIDSLIDTLNKVSAELVTCNERISFQAGTFSELNGKIGSLEAINVELNGKVDSLNTANAKLSYMVDQFNMFFTLADSSYNDLSDRYDSINAHYQCLKESFMYLEYMILERDSIIEVQDSIIKALSDTVEKEVVVHEDDRTPEQVDWMDFIDNISYHATKHDGEREQINFMPWFTGNMTPNGDPIIIESRAFLDGSFQSDEFVSLVVSVTFTDGTHVESFPIPYADGKPNCGDVILLSREDGGYYLKEARTTSEPIELTE